MQKDANRVDLEKINAGKCVFSPIVAVHRAGKESQQVFRLSLKKAGKNATVLFVICSVLLAAGLFRDAAVKPFSALNVAYGAGTRAERFGC